MPNKNYKVGDPRIDSLIDELTELCSPQDCQEHFRESLTTLAKFGSEHGDLGDFKLVNRALKEMRHALRIFLPYRNVRKVVVFGSARIGESDPCYLLTMELCEKLVDRKFMVITGAGGGVMEAANRGAGREKSFGINIQFPFEQKSNPYIEGDPKLMRFKYFFTRKLFFIKESDATILLPGGFGTLDEGFENLTLFKTGKCMPRPVILLEPESGNYWKGLLDYMESALVQNGYINSDENRLFQLVHTAGQAVDLVQEFYKVYHSLRYVKELTVVRINRELPAQTLDRLNDEFKDILIEGRIEASPPLKEEMKLNEFPHLPRLVMHFDKQNFGRLNDFIWKINRLAS